MHRKQTVPSELEPTGGFSAGRQANPFQDPSPVHNPFAVALPSETPAKDGLSGGKQRSLLAAQATEPAYEYRLLAAEGAPLQERSWETAELGVAVKVSWGRNVLAVKHLEAGQSFTIGGGELDEDCDYQVPSALLTHPRASIVIGGEVSRALLLPGIGGTVTRPGEPAKSILDVVASDGVEPHAEIPGAYTLALTEGLVVRLSFGELHFELSGERRGRRFGAALTMAALAGGAALYVVGSFLGHVGILAALAAWMPPMGSGADQGMTDEQRYFIRHHLEASQLREQEKAEAEEQAAAANDDSQAGGQGVRAKGQEGDMGDSMAKATGKRYALTGGDKDPMVARAQALEEAASFGIIPILSGSPDGPTAEWGALTMSGSDPLAANGNMWGDDPGTAFGSGGLGLTGIGEGGGGLGHGIGLDSVGTLGHGAGGGDLQGFGPGNGQRLGSGTSFSRNSLGRSARPPRIRIAEETTLGGRLPPEVIQRIVRANFGRFRGCYESALRSNPSLQGRVVVRFVVSRSGTVSHASGSGSLPDNGVVSCIVGGFYGLSFPQPEGGVVRVSYPIVLTPT